MAINRLNKPLVKAIKDLELMIEEKGGLGRPVFQKQIALTIQELASYLDNERVGMSIVNKAKELIKDMESVTRH